MSSTWGCKLKLNLFGHSHGSCVGGILDGLPAGIKIDMKQIANQMCRRKAKGDGVTSPRIETDEIKFISGITNNVTNGTSICVIVENNSANSADYEAIKYLPRPSHADYTARMKYGDFYDLRGGGHLSGRLTAPLVALGSICGQFLQEKGIVIAAHLFRVGDVFDTPFDKVKIDANELTKLRNSLSPALDLEKLKQMSLFVKQTVADGDSVGGTVECAVVNLPVGTGEPIFDNIESKVSSLVFSIPGVKAIEFGCGASFAGMKGSESNDSLYYDENKVKTLTNCSGGINGGIANGMPIILRATFRPTPSISLTQKTVNLETKENAQISVKGRHDGCIAFRGVVCLEAAVSIALADLLI